VAQPRFEEIPDVPITRLQGDWRWYVPEILQNHWDELSLEARLGILVMAQDWAAAKVVT